MKCWTLALVACLCTSCTMMSLKRHAVAQGNSATDLRYHEVMDNLAMIADDPTTLPSYASIFSGTAWVQDQGQQITTITWPRVFGAQAVNPMLNRQISQNWVLDTITSPEKVEAMRAACRWAIEGPEHIDKEGMSLLIRPELAEPGTERHFGGADKLAQLSPGWLGVGGARDVPLCACYKAHSGKTWVWVTADGMKGLTDFTLIIQDIARISINSPTLFNLPPIYTPIVLASAESVGPDNRMAMTAQVVIDQSGHLVPDIPYTKTRIDTLGIESQLRSAISAAGVTTGR